MTKILVDTNILVYAAIDDGSNKHNKAKEFLLQKITENQVVLSIQNIVEFSRILREKIKPAVDSNLVNQYISGFCSNCEILSYSHETVIKANLLNTAFGTHFFDSLLVSTMQENNIFEIATENEKDFEKIKTLKVLNPL